MAPVVHIVLFEFKPDTPKDVVATLCGQMMGLKDNCVAKGTDKTYITSCRGGLDNSPEGIQAGITHAFVMEFASEEDRNYYVSEDPVHTAFVNEVRKHLVKGQAVDFVPGKF